MSQVKKVQADELNSELGWSTIDDPQRSQHGERRAGVRAPEAELRRPDRKEFSLTCLASNDHLYASGRGTRMLALLFAASLASASASSADAATTQVAPSRSGVVSRSRYWRACKAHRSRAQLKGTLAGGVAGAAVGVVAMASPIGAAVGRVAGHYAGGAHVHCPNQASRSPRSRHSQTAASHARHKSSRPS